MPNLIIGLGGTGTKIVRKLREHWKQQVPRYVGFAVIDARSRNPEGGAMEGVTFTPTTPSDVTHTFGEFHDEVTKWWPKQVVPQSHIDFTNGCGAIRANGKFFSFAYAGLIERTIQKALNHLLSKSFTSGDEGGNNFSVYIVGSLGNGTGGGTFMDVAAIVKHILAARATNVQCYGVFIPGSVTKLGDPGTVGTRVSASGYASLIELQYEFNRGNSINEFSPFEPYQFVAWDGRFTKTYQAGRGNSNPGMVSPIDWVFLIDRTDRSGSTSDYHTLLNIAAESIIMLTEGRDEDNRLLDGLSHTPVGRKFGSFGAARLAVPAMLLLDFSACKQAIRSLETAVGEDEQRWRRLLSDQSPDKTKVLKQEDASVTASVKFFIGEVLKIMETGEGPSGDQEFNQLFDRFEAGDYRLLKEFDIITKGIEDMKDIAEIVQKGPRIGHFVTENTKDLHNQRRKDLIEGNESVWRKKPIDTNDPIDAGVRWLINERVKEFVNAGAFGLLNIWLKELGRQIEENYESVMRYERKKYLSESSHKEIDVSKDIIDIQEEANSIFAKFKRGDLIEDVEFISQKARNYFLYILWESKITVVEDFYDLVKNHITSLRLSTSKIVSWFSEKTFKKPLADKIQKITRELNVNIQQQTTAEGLRAILYVGADDSARKRILDYMDNNLETSVQEALEGMAAENRRVFLYALDNEMRNDFPEAEETVSPYTDLSILRDNYRNTLQSGLRKRVDKPLRNFCDIDIVLLDEAKFYLEEYYQCWHEDSDAIEEKKKANAYRKLEDVATSDFAELIQNLDWTSKSDAMEHAIGYVIAGRLRQLIRYATAQWNINHSLKEIKDIHVDVFFTYPRRATHIGIAVGKYNKQYQKELIRTQPLTYHNQRQIDILRVELGGRLESFLMDDEINNYRHCMFDQKGFCPHPTLQYYEVGKKYLGISGEVAVEAPALLALAELYGYIHSDSRGNYKISQDIEALVEKRHLIHSGYTKGTAIGPRGLRHFTEFLDGKSDDAVDLKSMLKSVLYDAITEDVWGSPGETEPLGWDSLGAKLTGHAADIKKFISNNPNDPNLDVRKRQANDIALLAADLVSNRGKMVPPLFK